MSILAFPAYANTEDQTDIIVHNPHIVVGRSGTKRITTQQTRTGRYKTVVEHDQPGRDMFLSTLRFFNLKGEDKDLLLEFLNAARNDYILFTEETAVAEFYKDLGGVNILSLSVERPTVVWILQVLNNDFEAVFTRARGRWEIVLDVKRWAAP